MSSPAIESAPCQVPEVLPGPRPAEWAHVVIRTTDPARLMEWYCTVLNAQVVLRHRLINFISWDDSQDRLAIMPDQNPPAAGRIDHFAITYGSTSDLVANYWRLEKLGILPTLAMNHGVTSSFYYRDPDGNQLETAVDNFDDVNALNAWLATGDFDENPYGVPVPPEDLAKKLEAVPFGQRLRPEPMHRTWLRNATKKRFTD